MRTAVITFGRMNAPTIGHEKLVTNLVRVAKQRKATPMVFLSHSQDAKKNPLTYDQKIALAQKAFGRIVVKSPARTIIEVLKTLQGKFTDVVVVVGSDRVEEFTRLLNTYNGKEFNFKSIEVISAGERDPDSEGVDGMSASKLRQLAKDKNVIGFKKGLPTNLQSDSDKIMMMLRTQMGLSESRAPIILSKALSIIKNNK